jgi:hypothetical protein
MVQTVTTRFGGFCGVVAALIVIPAYVVGSPETPKTPADIHDYYDDASTFITLNGTLPLLHLLFGLVFLAVLVSILRAASGPSPEVYALLVSGTVFIALTAAGLAAEVARPAAISKFGDVALAGPDQSFLMLAVWLYHYSQIAAAVMIFAASWAIDRTGALPKWSAAGALLGVLPLLHTWIGVTATYSTVAWVAAIGLVMLAFPTTERPK